MRRRLILWTKSIIKLKICEWIAAGESENEVDTLDQVYDKVNNTLLD